MNNVPFFCCAHFLNHLRYCSVDCSTDKPKQFRWNFHKKTKSSSSNSSQNNTNNTKNNIEANSITEEGILRLNELIDHLAKSESEYFKFKNQIIM